MVPGATGNVGGRIVQLLIERLEEEVAPHALGADVALAAFGVGKGSAKMPD
jgi:uncharacterized protein YbjT (DUF2867 family)